MLMYAGPWCGTVKLFFNPVGHGSTRLGQPRSGIIGSHKQVTDKLQSVLWLHHHVDGAGPQCLERIGVSCFTIGKLALKIITPHKKRL